ncbi:DUF4360 domain-containing protein [Bdellovibrio sp. HCB2-146]|uniref:DUF4360 domain-containing protein n=1 Tax=Bdellovibrio sp. HCB2-146 TaxID=3394362 RepID=UPI0039BD8FFF
MRITSWRVIALLSFISLKSFAAAPPGLRIENIQAVGSGCPVGSYSANISPDGSTFSLLLDNYVAESTIHNPIARLMCELKVSFRVPRGWSMAVMSADYRGFVYAEAGTVATHQAIYSFDGSRPRNERPGYENSGRYSFRAQEFRGPYSDNYYVRYQIDPRVAPWAACSANDVQTLYVTTFLMSRNLNLSAPVTAQISLDSVDGQLQSQNYQLAWRTCTPSGGGGVGPRPPDPGSPRPPAPGRPPRYP